MSQLSNYLENALANAVLRNVAFTSPVTVYLALYTSDPTDADVGTELTGGGYARQAITFAAPANGSCSNSAVITFPTATANLGTATHWGVRDAAAAGNLLWFGALTTAKIITNGSPYKVNAGQITCSIGGAASIYLANALLNAALRNTTFTSPATVYTACYVNDPTPSNIGTEFLGGGYARKASTFAAPLDGLCQSNALIDFGTASADLGTWTHSGVLDALTAGNLLFFDPLDSSLPVNNGDPYNIPSGQATWGFA